MFIFLLCGGSVLFGRECTVFWPEVSRASVRGSDISTLTIFNLLTPLFLSHHTILILPIQGWKNIIAPSCLMQCKYAITDRYSGSQDPSSYYTWLQFLSHRPWMHHLLSTASTTLNEIICFAFWSALPKSYYHISVLSKLLSSYFLKFCQTMANVIVEDCFLWKRKRWSAHNCYPSSYLGHVTRLPTIQNDRRLDESVFPYNSNTQSTSR